MAGLFNTSSRSDIGEPNVGMFGEHGDPIGQKPTSGIVYNDPVQRSTEEPNVGMFGPSPEEMGAYQTALDSFKKAETAAEKAETAASKVAIAEQLYKELSALDIKISQMKTDVDTKYADFLQKYIDANGNILNTIQTIQNEINTAKTEVGLAKTETEQYTNKAGTSAKEALSAKTKAEQAQAGANQAEINARAQEYEIRELIDEFADNYTSVRGLWNPASGSYPKEPDTNSQWTVTLDDPFNPFDFAGRTWSEGDLLLYFEENDPGKKWMHIHAGSAFFISTLDQTYQRKDEKNKAGGYAGVEPNGKLPESLLPSVSILDVEVDLNRYHRNARTNVQKGDMSILQGDRPWRANNAYKAGDIVYSAGATPADHEFYSAKIDFVSGSVFNAINWNSSNFVPGYSYKIGDEVINDNKKYIIIKNHIGEATDKIEKEPDKYLRDTSEDAGLSILRRNPTGPGGTTLESDWATIGAQIVVQSFNGRTGQVIPESGDYYASQITVTPYSGITETELQSFLEALYDVKMNKKGDTMSGNLIIEHDKEGLIQINAGLNKDVALVLTEANKAFGGELRYKSGTGGNTLELNVIDNSAVKPVFEVESHAQNIDFKARPTYNGSNILSEAESDAKYVEHSEVVNNLVTASTDVPLSANQGKLLKDISDTKYDRTGGTLNGSMDVTGTITSTNNNAFRHLASGTDAMIHISNNGEWIFAPKYNAGSWGDRSLKFNPISNRWQIDAHKIYHDGDRPTPSEIGAYSKAESDTKYPKKGDVLSKTGGVLAGDLEVEGKILVKDTYTPIGKAQSDVNAHLSLVEMNKGFPTLSFIKGGNGAQFFFDGKLKIKESQSDAGHLLYHEGHKPEWSEILNKPNVAIQSQRATFYALVATTPTGIRNHVLEDSDTVSTYRVDNPNGWRMWMPTAPNAGELFTVKPTGIVNVRQELQEGGERVYSPRNKPSWSDVENKPNVAVQSGDVTFDKVIVNNYSGGLTFGKLNTLGQGFIHGPSGAGDNLLTITKVANSDYTLQSSRFNASSLLQEQGQRVFSPNNLPSWGQVKGKPNIAELNKSAVFGGTVSLDGGVNRDVQLKLTEDSGKHGVILRYKGATDNTIRLNALAGSTEHTIFSADRGGNTINFTAKPQYKGVDLATTASTVSNATKLGNFNADKYMRSQGQLGATSNINAAFNSGFYKVQGVTSNLPTGAYNFGILKVVRDPDDTEGRCLQQYFPHRDNQGYWFRMRNNNVWQSWSRVYTDRNKPTWSDIGGNSWMYADGNFSRVGANKWLRAATVGTGFLPAESKKGTDAVSYLGTTNNWFKEAWVNDYHGKNVSVDGFVAASLLKTDNLESTAGYRLLSAGSSQDKVLRLGSTAGVEEHVRVHGTRADGKNLSVWKNGADKWVYHEGNKPTPQEIGALPVGAKAVNTTLFDGRSSQQYIYGSNSFGTTKIPDAKNNRKSGFIEMYQGTNQPGRNNAWAWGIQTSHIGNGVDGKYGSQILINQDNQMFFRIQDKLGNGTWRQPYHDGNKPTWDEVANKPSVMINGADKISAGEISFTSAGSGDLASLTCSTEGGKTFFDSYLGDDVNQDSWRWLFKYWNHPTTETMMKLRPISSTASVLEVSGQIMESGQRVYSPNHKPSWADVGGNNWMYADGDFLRVGRSKWLKAGSDGSGFLPATPGGVNSAHSNLGTNSWWFNSAYIRNVNAKEVVASGTFTSTFANALRHKANGVDAMIHVSSVGEWIFAPKYNNGAWEGENLNFKTSTDKWCINAHPIYHEGNKPTIDEINPNIEVTRTYSMEADSWVSVIGKQVLPASGVYQMLIQYTSNGKGGKAYYQNYTGQFYWYSLDTNQAGSSEIPMHHMGHADNNEILYARTRTTSGRKGDQAIQIRCDSALTDCPFTFKFKRIM